jgi:hypothetical protein
VAALGKNGDENNLIFSDKGAGINVLKKKVTNSRYPYLILYIFL